MKRFTDKIGRLPGNVLKQLNQRIQAGEANASLVKWLNSLPEVQARLKESFRGKPIQAKNLAKWRANGYPHWVLENKKISQVLKHAETIVPEFRDLRAGCHVAVMPFHHIISRAVKAACELYERGTFDAEGNFTPPPVKAVKGLVKVIQGT